MSAIHDCASVVNDSVSAIHDCVSVTHDCASELKWLGCVWESFLRNLSISNLGSLQV